MSVPFYDVSLSLRLKTLFSSNLNSETNWKKEKYLANTILFHKIWTPAVVRIIWSSIFERKPADRNHAIAPIYGLLEPVWTPIILFSANEKRYFRLKPAHQTRKTQMCLGELEKCFLIFNVKLYCKKILNSLLNPGSCSELSVVCCYKIW